MQARQRAKQGKIDDSRNLETMINSGESGAYEALQLYRSRAIRAYAKGEHMSAVKTTVDGCIKLIKGTYLASAAELCNQLIEFLDESQLDIDTPEVREIVLSVDDALVVAVLNGETDSDNNKEDANALKLRKDFLKGAVKWTKTYSGKDFGDSALHLRLGGAMWSTETKGAIFHFVAGESPFELARKISDTLGSNMDKEVILRRDRNILSAVCHFLALENLRDANEVFNLFKKAQKARGNSVDTKLVLFCTQLLECCRRDAAPLYKQLLGAITIDLEQWQGENITSLLNGPIGTKFFGIQPKVHPMMQMMQQFLI